MKLNIRKYVVMKQAIVTLITKPTRCVNSSNLFLEWNSTCFGQSLCPSSGVQHSTHSKTCMTYTYCSVYNAGLMMMDKGTVRNM